MNASDRLEPFYQPIADLGSGIIVGFESKPHLSSAGNVAKCASWVFEHKNIEPQTRFRLDNAMSYKAVQYFSQRNDCAQLFINIRPEWLNPLFANIDPAVLRASEKLGNDQADIVVQIPENSIDQAFVLYLCTKLKMANIKIAVTECNLNTSAMAAIAALQPDYVKLQAPSKSRDTNKNVTETARRIRQLHNETPCDVIVSDIYNESDFCFAIDSGADKIQGPLIAKSRREASSRFYALEQITQLKKRRLNSKTQHLKASFKNEHQTTRHMQILLNAFHTNTLKSVNAAQIEQAGIVRFFTCDRLGYQISPEFIFQDGRVLSRLHSMGWNWAHRPNFSMLHALNESVNRQHAVSPPYYDDESKSYRKTHSFLFGDGDVALIEVHTSAVEEREVV